MWSLADIHSLTPLLNSFFFEWKNFRLQPPFIILECHGDPLYIELKKFSAIGHHQYTGNIYWKEKTLSFEDFLNKFTQVLNWQESGNFIARIQQSRDSIQQALDSNIEQFKEIKPNFPHTETSLFVGHSLHPTPKSRSEFSSDDLNKFSPEHGGRFNLFWFKVHQSIFLEKHSTHFKDSHWQQTLCAFEVESDYRLLPLHPWQRKHILELDVIKDYLKSGLIVDLGIDPLLWTPTSSLRTLYQASAKYMLKFSLNLKMTNSVRHLLLHELDRGIQIDEVSKHQHMSSFFKDFPHFKIIQEPLYAGIIDKNKAPIKETLIMLRENPFAADEEVSLLATLTQPQVEFNKSVLASLIEKSELSAKEWFHLFLQEAIAPLLVAQGSYGLLLGAHQQNLILKLDHGKPVGAYFRDCHGTGYDGEKIKNLRQDIPSIKDENGNVLAKEISYYLFAYYVVINSVFNMISAVAAQTQENEETLLETFSNFLMTLKDRSDLSPQFIDYLLSSPELKHKGNFFCTLKNLNENTQQNPLDIYLSIPNPLKEYAND